MAYSTKVTVKKGDIIIIAIVLTITLYLLGVISGLIANKILESRVEAELADIKGMIDTSSLDVKNIQLQMLFIDNFDPHNRCDFMNLYLDYMYSQISYYWDTLPARLEEYELRHRQPPEYTALKREYIRLSLRFWVIASNNYEDCNNRQFIPILYFYTSSCEECVEQGLEFDEFGAGMKEQNRTVLVFPIDADFSDDTVYLLKKFYNISEAPAVVIKGVPIQGRIVGAEWLELEYG